MKKLLVVLGVIFALCGSFLFYLHHNYEVPILMYHSFDADKINSYAAITPEIFDQQMKFIKRNRYEVIGLEQYCRMLKDNKPIPKNLIVITMDDGYKDNLKAIAVLKELDYPATIFVPADKISEQGYLSQEDIEDFLKNTRVRIGSHAVSHAYLPDVSDLKLKKEVFKSKDILEERFFQDVNTIAYPVGGFNEEVLAKVKEAGYLCACTTNRGFSNELDRFSLRRIKITNRDVGFRLWAKLSGFYNIFKKAKDPY